MPKCEAKVVNRKIAVDARTGKSRMLVLLQFNKVWPSVDETVKVKWGSIRTLSQNALYWVFLTWCIEEGGLKDQGWFSAEALHYNLKQYFLAKKEYTKGEFQAIEEATTTDMCKSEFGEYVDKVNQFMLDFFSIDTTPFWQQHREVYGTY